jgi:AcrR family transcriptional regulator
VSELSDRRARKKAQTRELIRTVAQRLFAERGFDCVTIADVAREADVAVQTVFNHFAAKEDLFFDGRTPWLDGFAESVRSREPGVPPLAALRAYLVAQTAALLESMCTDQRRSYVATIEASPALKTRERELIFESERQLAGALLDVWTEAPEETATPVPADPRAAAPLTAALWVAAVRSLIIEYRPDATRDGNAARVAATAEALLDRLLAQLETGLMVMAGPSADTGWPEAAPTADRKAG